MRRDFDDDDDVLPDIQNSSCGNESYATGATVWSSDSFVYGVMLECADLAETCAPPSYPTNAIAGESQVKYDPCPGNHVRNTSANLSSDAYGMGL